MFGVIIECDKKDGFRYYIYNAEVLEEDSIQNWMLSTLSVNSILSESKGVLVLAGYQQTHGGYIDKAKSLAMEVDYQKNLPSQYWHLMSYCDTKRDEYRFTKSVVCGELIFWMSEALDCIPKERLENLVNEIACSRILASNGRYFFDRKHWYKEIQKLCFDSISRVVNQIQ